ncbi:MAG: ABC transporter substrate-binding protein [candidate division WOR-3 bacterium]
MKGIAKYTVILLILLIVIVCKKKSDIPKPGGEVRIAWTGGLIGVDPQKDWGCAGAMKIIRLVYSPLYSVDNPELGLAQSFSHSPDYTEWEFVLKKDCFFHTDPCFDYNPRRVSAYDVKYTYELMKNPNPALELEPVNRIKEIIVLDSFRIKFILKESDKNFVRRLDNEMVYITPSEARERYKDNFCFHPVGSGPFCFEFWNEKVLTLVKNKNFWAKDKVGQKLPYLDKIVIKFFGDINQCINALLNNEVDISPVNAEVADLIFEKLGDQFMVKEDYENSIQIIRCPFPSLTILLNNWENPTLKDPLVRKALNYGVNRDEITKILALPFALPAYGPTLKYFCEFKYEYNPQMAIELLKKAGYKNGLKGLFFQHYPNPFSRQIAEVLQSQLAKIGIETKLSCATRVAALRGHPRWDFDLITIIYSDSTPSSHLHLYYSGSAPWVDFRSSVFDSLWKSYDAQPDSLLICKMDSLVLEEPPFVFLYWSYPCFLAKKNLESLDPLSYISPYTWWKNE